jgi:hypothetical protein
MSSSPATVPAFDNTTTPTRASSPLTSVGRRISVIAAIAGASGVSTYPIAADRKVNRSCALERSAPVPASVGKSQFATGCSIWPWPTANRVFISGDNLNAERRDYIVVEL